MVTLERHREGTRTVDICLGLSIRLHTCKKVREMSLLQINKEIRERISRVGLFNISFNSVFWSLR